MRRIDTIALSVAMAALIGIMVWTGYIILGIPTVYESYTTGECVRVDDPDGVYSCENMPSRFHHRWSQ